MKIYVQAAPTNEIRSCEISIEILSISMEISNNLVKAKFLLEAKKILSALIEGKIIMDISVATAQI